MFPVKQSYVPVCEIHADIVKIWQCALVTSFSCSWTLMSMCFHNPLFSPTLPNTHVWQPLLYAMFCMPYVTTTFVWHACVTLPLQPATTCPDYPITTYTIHLHNTITNTTTSHTITPDLHLWLQLNSSDGLVKDTHYTYYITAKNGAGTGLSLSREMSKYRDAEEFCIFVKMY